MERPIRRRAAALLAAALLLGATASQDEPLAVVLKVQGEVALHRGEADPAPAGTGTRLVLGDRLEPAEGASATLVTRTGRKEEVTEPILIQPGEGAYDGDVFTRTVGVLTQAARGTARTAPNRQGMIRPIPGIPGQIRPRNGIVVATPSPVFTWFAVPGATTYTLQLRTAGELPRRYTSSDTTFVLPEPLEPGRTWFWTVGAGARAAPEDSFRTLSEEGAAALAESLAAVAGMGFDPADDGRLLAVILYTDLGLSYRALEELEALEAETGGLGADALLLKGELLDRLGRLDEARAAFDAADALLEGR